MPDDGSWTATETNMAGLFQELAITAEDCTICVYLYIDQHYVHSNSVSLGTGTQCTDRDVH